MAGRPVGSTNHKHPVTGKPDPHVKRYFSISETAFRYFQEIYGGTPRLEEEARLPENVARLFPEHATIPQNKKPPIHAPVPPPEPERILVPSPESAPLEELINTILEPPFEPATPEAPMDAETQPEAALDPATSEEPISTVLDPPFEPDADPVSEPEPDPIPEAPADPSSKWFDL